MHRIVDEAIKITRRISSALRPGLLDDLGLFPALEWLNGEFDQRSGLSCSLSLPPEEPDLDPDLKTALFRIFQESLTNIARHAQATRVKSEVTIDEGELRMEIKDNGRGITQSELHDVGALGLLGMQERAAQWGGMVQFMSKKGKGTTVRVQIPLPAARKTAGSNTV